MATAAQAIRAAEDRLQTARFGLQDMRSRPERVQSGLYNAVVFGRMVTFSLQTMRKEVKGFEEWYEPKIKEMRADPLLQYFWNMRTEIEKEAKRHTTSSLYLHRFGSGDMARMGPPPPGATTFFLGDANGGCGWKVPMTDGSVETYYVDLPPDLGRATVHLSEAPEKLRGVPAAELVPRYLDYLALLIAEAKWTFANG